jgi:hypothetical protein
MARSNGYRLPESASRMYLPDAAGLLTTLRDNADIA